MPWICAFFKQKKTSFLKENSASQPFLENVLKVFFNEKILSFLFFTTYPKLNKNSINY